MPLKSAMTTVSVPLSLWMEKDDLGMDQSNKGPHSCFFFFPWQT